ncbi:MAG: hypothetical protein IK081_10375 [Lachnospiraceae bacterium]|nr:hypothetical protein [Lachnospiraceae bacterium]
MATIDELTVLTDEHPIPYESKMIVYFVFNNTETPIILTTRYVAGKNELIEWLIKANKDPEIRIVAVWPGQYRSEAFVCDPKIALKAFGKE